MWERPSCQWSPPAAASSRRGFLPRQQTPLKEKLLPTQTLFAFTPKSKLCARRRHRSAGSSCRGLKRGNSGVRATGTGSRSSVSKAAPQKTMRCVLLASRQPWISTCFNPKPPLSKATSQENFQKRKGEKITQTNEITCSFGVILRTREVQV